MVDKAHVSLQFILGTSGFRFARAYLQIFWLFERHGVPVEGITACVLLERTSIECMLCLKYADAGMCLCHVRSGLRLGLQFSTVDPPSDFYNSVSQVRM